MNKIQLLKVLIILTGITIIGITGYETWKVNEDIKKTVFTLSELPFARPGWNEHIDKTGIRFKYPDKFYIADKEEDNIVFKSKDSNDLIGDFHVSFREKIYEQAMDISKLQESAVWEGSEVISVIIVDGIESLKYSIGNNSFDFKAGEPPIYFENIQIPYQKAVYFFEIEVSLDPTNEASVNKARNYYKLYEAMISSINIPK